MSACSAVIRHSPAPLIELRAPVSGTIVEQNVSGFEGIKSLDNSPNLFTIADLYASLGGMRCLRKRSRASSPGRFRGDRLNAYPGEVYHGKVADISRVLDPNLRSAKVRIVLPNPDGTLRPNMYAVATFRSSQLRPRLVVPTTAVMRLQDKDWVFRKESPNQFRKIEVLSSRCNLRWIARVAGWRGKDRRRDRSQCARVFYRHGGDQRMIRGLIDFALRERILVLSVALVLFIWGIISFHNLPIEAYPDVADTYTQIISQWPGHAAEEVEQQITVPLEVQLNGVPHMTHLRSVSLAGLSVITIIYDDEITTFTARQEVLDRLAQATMPAGVNPGFGSDYSPTGQIMFYTLKSTNPKYDVMELKTLQDWFVLNQLKSVPNIVEVNIFGGPTREYQVQLDPGKLVSYGLSIGQVEQALTNNNLNAGGGFIERGEQALNVRAVGLMTNTDDVGATVVKAVNGTPVRVRDLGVVVQAPKVRLGQLGKTIRHEDGTVLNDDDVVEGIVLLRKGAEADSTLEALHRKIDELNNGLLPKGVKFVPHLDRSILVHHTTSTVLRNLTDGSAAGQLSSCFSSWATSAAR